MSVDHPADRSYDQLIAASGLPRLEARMLLEHASGCSRSWLIAHGDEPADAQTTTYFLALAERRTRAGEPIAYLTGVREFHSLRLAVSPAVLIPRPETELLVDRALELIVNNNDHAGTAPSILDLGTGSGAIALAIAATQPRARIVATDRSAAALNQARANASQLGLDSRIEWRLGDWWEAVGEAERFSLVLANPPYIARHDPHLSQGDLRHEPIEALASGEDGLDAIRTIAAGARGHLTDRGWLLLEHGFDQGEPVRALLEAAGFAWVRTLEDLEGRERVTQAQKTLESQDPPAFMV
jgi:release factor glutamine methyltransferase